MQNFLTHNPDGTLKSKQHLIMLREACPPEDEEELDNLINTYASNS